LHTVFRELRLASQLSREGCPAEASRGERRARDLRRRAPHGWQASCQAKAARRSDARSGTLRSVAKAGSLRLASQQSGEGCAPKRREERNPPERREGGLLTAGKPVVTRRLRAEAATRRRRAIKTAPVIRIEGCSYCSRAEGLRVQLSQSVLSARPNSSVSHPKRLATSLH
jgi:hypothetical protein